MKALRLAALLLCATACSTVTTTPAVSIASSQGIAILPLKNLSSTPLAGEQVATIAESVLRSRGVAELKTYDAPKALGLNALLETSTQSAPGKAWAKESGLPLALSGTVHEWHYKSGPDREPSVALSLTLTDVQSGRVVWQATSAKAGWGFSSLSTVGQKLVDELLEGVQVQPNL
jgi:polysaccharide biosynthesis protein PelC